MCGAVHAVGRYGRANVLINNYIFVLLFVYLSIKQSRIFTIFITIDIEQ